MARKIKSGLKHKKNLPLLNAEMKSLVLKVPLTEDHLMRHTFVICKNIYEMVIGLIYSMVSTKKKRSGTYAEGKHTIGMDLRRVNLNSTWALITHC